ncbi:hypothetical protein CYY_000092 [Polysphondylium violaceum]|uniref:GPI ethanolamine phosphate transferase 1 n=1 Tax=Polysphondylium violaceum TaxID=133409 RepID=A0A8J4Q4J1_9MYCE|nr:hypothetical protein CYY_000092 [Polysphondylium violaceum]
MYHIYSSDIQPIAKGHSKKNDKNSEDQKKRFNSKVLVIVLIGILFHAVFTLSIFDIYFRSPLVHGMTPHPVHSQPPAKRLVLFVADGLRADKFYELENQTSRAPFLRDIVENKGSWGVSHTRVPTETRPGHVALIAGFYEDVSAVTKGWKSNPVEFDHLFNQTRYSWGYGSPDILPMFSDHVPHMTSESYPPDAEDYGADASKLDTWVFDKIEELFNNASRDPELDKRLRSDKIAIFLHLLGLDTNGHAYRPYSKEYYDNIGVVDRGIEKMCKLIEDFYGDQSTAYVFTADHGMSNRGSHGDGERANTETPLVAWGKGVRGPLSAQFQMDRIAKLRGKGKETLLANPETPENWKLSHLMRSDVSQADVAPLMTSLIGIPSPLNSVGVLPTDYLGTDAQYTTLALYSNTLQIYEMYVVKSTSKKATSLLFFSPFTKLVDAQQRLDHINQLIDTKQYDDAQILCLDMIQLCLEGLNYFQTYDRPFLMTIVSLGYFGWIITLGLYVINNYTLIGTNCHHLILTSTIPKFQTLSKLLIVGMSVVLYGFLLSNESPLLYYLYCTFVILFWGKTIPSNIVPLYIFLGNNLLGSIANSQPSVEQKRQSKKIIKNFVILVVSAIFVMELLVVAYFNRSVLSIIYIAIGIVSLFTIAKKQNILFKSLWMVSCLLMSIFPNLPIDYGNDTNLVCLGGVLVALLSFLALNALKSSSKNTNNINSSSSNSGTKKKSQTFIIALIVVLLLSTWIVYSTDKSLEKKIGLPFVNQIASWFILLSSMVVLGVYRGKGYYDHWTFLCIALSIPFLLLSISFEVLFFGCFILNLTLWMIFELKVDSHPKLVSNTISTLTSSSVASFSMSNITQQDIRRAIIYIFFCYVGFFGTGNIASISSFEISSTYRFSTIFSPFLMAILLLIKIFIPLLLVAVSFSLLNNSLNIPRPGSFLVVIALSDIMSLNFFFLVKDYGSWLEIGTSISHYGISNAFIILQLLLFTVSSLLVPTNLKSPASNK